MAQPPSSQPDVPRRRTAPRPSAKPESDGPNLVWLTIGLSILACVLIVVGVRTWVIPNLKAPAVMSPAMLLGYKSEHDYQSDTRLANGAMQDALEAGPGGQRRWENEETGNRGIIWGAGETVQANGSTCRELTRRVSINRTYLEQQTTICHQPGKDWPAEAAWPGLNSGR